MFDGHRFGLGNLYRVVVCGCGLHIYNPHDGNEPVSGIVSLTVIGPNIHDADRFATAAFAMGPAGINFIEQLSGYEGYIIDKNKVATMTTGFDKYTNA